MITSISQCVIGVGGADSSLSGSSSSLSSSSSLNTISLSLPFSMVNHFLLKFNKCHFLLKFKIKIKDCPISSFFLSSESHYMFEKS